MIEADTISHDISGKAKTTKVTSVFLSKILKQFRRGLIANNGITIHTSAGDVHAILGENGAGKTTLMKILAGLLIPDSGHIEIDGIKRIFKSPLEAKRCGIGMVHQNFSLVPALTVSENLALSHYGGGFFLNPKAWRKQISKFAEKNCIDIRPDIPVSKLSLGEQQRIEILRLLIEGARILVLDEPTSILAPQESETLFTHIRRIADSGSIIFLVTHKIHHVRAVASRVSVLRRGELVASLSDCNISDSELASLMVGKSLASKVTINGNRKSSNIHSDEVILNVHNLSVSPIKCPVGLKRISFNVRRGEIIGVAGISGNGQDELAAAITGSVKYKGNVSFQTLNGNAPGIGYVPSDRTSDGLALSLPMEKNLSLRVYKKHPFTIFGLLNQKKITSYAKTQIIRYNIHPNDPSTTVQLLSGGNMQKVLLARELDAAKDLLVAANPTAGLDVNTVAFVNAQLLIKSKQGCAIILISEDLDELFALCHRILVLNKGTSRGILKTDGVLKAKVGLLMSNSPDSDSTSTNKNINIRSKL